MSVLASTRYGRRALFAALYFSEGAPIGFLWWALPVLLRRHDMPVQVIGSTLAMLALPWTIKFLWAPMVDRLRGRQWGHRAWIVSAQLLMGLTLLPLVWLDPARDFGVVWWLLLAHALAATTQDVAIDAWAIHLTQRDERAGLSGFMQAGMLSGRWLFGAGLLLLRGTLPQALVIGLLVAAVWCTTLLVLIAGPGRASRDQPMGKFWPVIKQVLSRRNTWLGMALALLAGAAFESTAGMAGVLLTDMGFSETQSGAYFTARVVAMLSGSLAGGLLFDRLSRRISVGGSIVYVALAVGAVAGCTALDLPRGAYVALVAMDLGIGLLTASSYALWMDLTDDRIGGTQFSAYMGATNACEVWAIFLVGQLAAGYGYAAAFSVMALLSLLALPVLGMISEGEAQSS